ncbi:PTS sugar transporter subunit IIA, partial [Desulfosarcina sp. OttesenSCG-928-A07]|nr:PTS sugar transporter subunit IIA [Desulfosarcina sp. OttesenSCG-928-G17]MDL2330211.1 PTS sugar transporter subunit IIA [Desulfosarcina sp. OttesenSCG-928-A07]
VGENGDKRHRMKLPIEKVASALGLPISTLERWIWQGCIPAQQNGNDVLFVRPNLEKWAASRQLPLQLDSVSSSSSTDPSDTLAAAMEQGCVCYDVAGGCVHEVLKAAVERLACFSPTVQEELFFHIMDRERLASTAIGNGIAIPHPRVLLSKPLELAMISTCFLSSPVDFNAVDGLLVDLVFLLITPTAKHHLHLLSRLAHCIRNPEFCDFLKTRPDPSALISRVAAIEAELDSTPDLSMHYF